jgi:GPH family glycoside/pentoside/hexuronide:cation symporter
MYTDCAEFGEWQTGKRTSGLIVAASMFSLKIGIAFGAAIPGYVLAAFGYVADEVQTAKAITGIRLMFNIIPAIFFFLGAIAMLFYKIDRAKLSLIESELSERRHSEPNQEADM